MKKIAKPDAAWILTCDTPYKYQGRTERKKEKKGEGTTF
jgi:hypothetical protein